MPPRFQKPAAPGTALRPARLFAAIALCFLAGASHAMSIGGYRLTAESPHFFITAEPDRAPTAQEAAARLETAFDSLTRFFDFTPRGKINAVLIDDEDYSNGFAYSANSWIVLYLPPARFELRGATSWIPNVSAHELSHIITLRKMGRTSRYLGVEAFASLGFRHGRADAEAAWLPKDVPTWLAEGLAQYGSMHCGFDTLDSHRRMLLREAWKAGTLLPLKAMETFSGDARQAETVYDQGFHLVDFLYRTRGRNAVNAMLKAWDPQGYGGAFRAAFGVGPEEIYAEWREELDSLYEGQPGLARETREIPPYRIEGAPVWDEKRDILYFISSQANDFGITHLYARTSKETRLIQRDVSPPLRLARDGSLLFTAVRTRAATGARLGDLYRYVPGAWRAERITSGLRAFAGDQAGARVFALVHHKGRTRLVRLGARGKPDLWIDAPAGAEFSSLAAGDDSTLYLGVVRGTNSDILRVDLRTGLLAPAEASAHNEIDPVVREGRLYFASDASGEYAVYSRVDGVARRLTPAGVSAFQPFPGRDSLWYSAYGAEGFRIAAAPLDPFASVAPGAAPGEPAPGLPVDTSNHAFPPPPKPSLKRLGYDRAGMELLGYYATLGYSLTPSRAVVNFDGIDDPVRLNPCGQQAYAGGGLLFADPAERRSFSTDFLAAQCLEGMEGTTTYLPYASLQYVSRDHLPDLIFSAAYEAMPLQFNEGPDRLGYEHQFQVSYAALYHLGEYAYDMPFGQIGGLIVDLPGPSDGEQNGGGVGAGNTLGFAVYDPGADFINRGFYAEGSALAAPGMAAFAENAGLFTNVERVLFLGAQTQAYQSTRSADDFSGGFLLSADGRMPLGISVGGAGWSGMFFESFFLRAGYSRQWNTHSGIGLTASNGLRPLHYGLAQRYAAAPVLQVQNLAPQMLRLGIRLKMISPGSRVVYADADWQAPPDGVNDGYFSFSISL